MSERLKRPWRECHGHLGDASWPTPRLCARSDEANRADQGNTIRANEYLDEPEVLEAKIALLADLVRRSHHCTAYTGAGLSKTAGIPDYATRAKNSVVGKAPQLRSSLDALPTLAHHVLVSMERAGLVHHYVQQNHDGLPQKAGFPQEKINEIHGAWFDPSNPVVPFSGSLRDDLFTWMLEEEQRTDLCLCLGTSLSGMNADRMAATPAERFLEGEEGILGTVIVNLQRTGLDAQSSLRLWAKLDDVFERLTRHLDLPVPDMANPPLFALPPTEIEDVFFVPYNAGGIHNPTARMRLDLRKGQRVYVPIDVAPNAGAHATVAGKSREGNVLIHFDGARRRNVLGRWWIDAALRGALPQLPVMNEAPRIHAVTPLPNALELVQSHTPVEAPEGSSNTHLWGLQLGEGSEAWVERVDWMLHPTFSPQMVPTTQPPFVIQRRGWGTFAVRAKITLKPEVAARIGSRELEAVHELSFADTGERAKITQVALAR